MASAAPSEPSTPTSLTLSAHPTPQGSSKPSGLAHSKYPEDDPCTDRCRSKQHGSMIFKIGIGSDGKEVVALWEKTCLNYSQVKDEFGRTALHAAASSGNIKALEWLIKTQVCNLNAKDLISGYTALHRSIYFGHFDAATALIKHGADVNIRDNEGFTAYEMCQMDRPLQFQANQTDATEVLVWGSNDNYNLGLGHQQERLYPDFAEKFRRADDKGIRQVSMDTYHTGFLTKAGRLYTCGYGMGGRLGTGNERAALHPTQVNMKQAVTQISLGLNHTVFISDGRVWAVGSNEFGQIGQPKSVNKLFTPRTIGLLDKYKVTDVIATKISSVFYNSRVIWMCGYNQGQFGYGNFMIGNTYIPMSVCCSTSAVFAQPGTLGTLERRPLFTSVAASETCTAICIDHVSLYLLRHGKQMRIDSKGIISHKVTKLVIDDKPATLTVFALNSSGRVLIWREGNEGRGAFTRVVYNNSRILDGVDISVNQSSIMLVTKTGEAYVSRWDSHNAPVIVGKIEEKLGQVANNDFQVAVNSRRSRRTEDVVTLWLEQLKFKRMPHIYTALSATSDTKGHNFGVVTRNLLADVKKEPTLEYSTMRGDYRSFYEGIDEGDFVHDVIFQVGGTRIPAHAFVLAEYSTGFKRILTEVWTNRPIERDVVVEVKNEWFGIDTTRTASLEDPKNFKAILDMIYTGTCYMLQDEYLKELRDYLEKGVSHPDDIYVKKAGEMEAMASLCRAIESQLLIALMEHLVRQAAACRRTPMEVLYLLHPPSVFFPRRTSCTFFDTQIVCSDGNVINAHRGVLAARSMYFRSMFSAHWQTPSEEMLKIPVPHPFRAMDKVLDFMYKDNTNVLNDSDLDIMWEVLVCADFHMIGRLFNIAERELAKNICLKNVDQWLTQAWMYSAKQLQSSCFEFMALNIAAVLESKTCEPLEPQQMKLFGDHYRQIRQHNEGINRAIVASADMPTEMDYQEALSLMSVENLELLDNIESTDDVFVAKKSSAKAARNKARRALRNVSESESVVEDTGSQETAQVSGHSVRSPAGAGSQEPPTPVATPKGKKFIVPLPKNNIAIDEPVAGPSTSIKLEEFPSLASGASGGQARAAEVTQWNSGTGNQVVRSTSLSQAPLPNNAPKKSQSATPSGTKKKTKWRRLTDITTIQPPVAVMAGPSGGTGGVQTDGAVAGPSGTSGAVAGSSGTISLTADGRDRNNPWRTNTRAEVPFNAIVQDEEERRRNLEKATTKSLTMMQYEDEMINYLTRLYSSPDTRRNIEMCKVERVDDSNYSTPTWVQHPGAVRPPSDTNPQ